MFNFGKFHIVKVIIYMLYKFIHRKKIFSFPSALLIILLLVSCENQSEPMPEFKFFTTQRQWITSNELKDGNIVIIYFNSGCEYCQEEMADIYAMNNAFKAKKIDFLFVSLESLSSLQHFTSIFAYDTIPNWIFAHVSPVQVDSLFKTETVPTIFMYKKGLLLDKSNGQLDAEDILDEF